MAVPKSEQIEALGRPFQLGRLYDIRTDQIINRSLWNQSELTEDKITINPQPFNDFKVEVSNTVAESFKLMDISASLQMSFMGGLVDVSGSASYLDKRNTKSNSTSVTMMHNMTTDYRSLGEEQMNNVTHKQLLDLEEATHVITGILYGARAYFKFEKTVGANETEKEISGNLQVAVKSIPTFQISGEGSVEMTDDERKNSEDISCQFVGDYTNIGIPTNFEESVRVFKEISTPEDHENRKVVPITVYLTPIQQLDSDAARLVREISKNAVDQCSDLMNYLRKVETKLNTLKLSKTSQYFPEFADFVEKVDGQFSIMANELQSKMANILPTIRGGGIEEQQLLEIITDFETTIFTSEYFDKWFKYQEDEVKAMDGFLIYLEERRVQVVKTPGELRLKMNTEKEGIVALTAGFVSFLDKQMLIDLKENSKDHPPEYEYPANNTKVWLMDGTFHRKIYKQRKDLLHALDNNEKNFDFIFHVTYGVEENYCTTKFYKDGVEERDDLDLSNSDKEINNVRYNESSHQLEGSVDSDLIFGKEIQYRVVEDTEGQLTTVQILPELSPGVYQAQMRCILNDQGMVGRWSEVVNFVKRGVVLLESTSDAAEHHDKLGYFDELPEKVNERPVYVQRGREGNNIFISYDGVESWGVGSNPGKPGEYLKVGSNSMLPPTSGWLHSTFFNREWVWSMEIDLSLRLTINPSDLENCNNINVSASGPAGVKYNDHMGLYKWLPGQWQKGRKVYSNGNAYLSIKKGFANWSTGGLSGLDGLWAGKGTTFPWYPETGPSKRNGRAGWGYRENDETIVDTSITVTQV